MSGEAPHAQVFFAKKVEEKGNETMPAGFALCGFRNSSSAGQSSIGLDDLSMNERGRSRGMGAGLMSWAQEKDCSHIA
eukprot:CAMPEP_0177730330 /NCGR_PEP_ID=MMETSP0484_2-20121128/21928_1 /TAXON_ID=354590 /ORGANISM="Rhodomonas lens, Strain RHODO" /LENGTH=77 /DNA_ID=CAMNT_0019243305 /DNA_START=102 /DNA_END=335 /DNA_ORIENTATION=-